MYLRFIFIFIFLSSEIFAELDGIVKQIPESQRIDIISKENKLLFSWKKETFANLTKVGDKWWFIFNQKALEINLPKDRDLPKGIVSINPIFDYSSSDEITIFEIKVDGPFDLFIQKQDDTWTLQTVDIIEERRKLTSGQFDPLVKNSTKNSLDLSIRKWPSYELNNLKVFQMVSVLKNDSKKEYAFILTKDLDQGISTFFETPYFIILQTEQGFSMQNLSDNVLLITNKKSVDIVVPNAPDAISISKISQIKTKKEDFQVSVFKKISFSDLKAEIEKLKEHFLIEKNNPMEHLLQSWIYLLLGDQKQAIAFIDILLGYYPALEHHPFIRILKASSLLLDKSYAKANEYMFALPKTLEYQVLKAIISASEELPDEYAKKLKKIKLLYQNYNDDLKDELFAQIIISCLNCAEYDLLLDVLDQIKNPEDTHIFLLYKFARLLLDKKIKNEEIKSDQFKALLKEKPWDVIHPQTKAYILFELANLEMEEQKIKKEEYIKKLIDLQFLWRGDIFELRLLERMGAYYVQEHHYIEALMCYEKINKTFKETFKILHLDKNMQECFSNFFKEKMYINKSPLRIVGLFEKYQEYVPETEEGKLIGQIVADILIDLNLLDNAAELLMKWMMHEKDEKIKTKVLLKIANIHIENQNGDAALSALDKIPEDQKNAVLEEFDSLKIASLVMINKKDEAIKRLEEKNTPESMEKIIDIMLMDNQIAKAHQKLSDKLIQLDLKPNAPLKMECLILLAKINIQLGDFAENDALKIMHENFIKRQPKEKQEMFDYLTDNPQLPGIITRKVIDDQLKSSAKIRELREDISKKK
jgi:predicted negative regulator of RcsB-dependent stress response